MVNSGLPVFSLSASLLLEQVWGKMTLLTTAAMYSFKVVVLTRAAHHDAFTVSVTLMTCTGKHCTYTWPGLVSS